MSDYPQIEITTGFKLTPDLLMKIESTVRESVNKEHARLLEKEISRLLEKEISRLSEEQEIILKRMEERFKEISEAHEELARLVYETPEFDIDLIELKMKKNLDLTQAERIVLEKHIFKVLQDELKEIASGKYAALSLEGEILAIADSRMELLEMIDKIDYPASKIFLHRAGKKPFVERI